MRTETGPLSLSLGQGCPNHVHRWFHINIRMFFLSELVITVKFIKNSTHVLLMNLQSSINLLCLRITHNFHRFTTDSCDFKL